MGALTEPSTYDADITPENMQRGMTAYAQGKKIVGTGKCFEFAEYGLYRAKKLSNGYYGFSFQFDKSANTFFVAPTGTGDIVVQKVHLVELEDEPIKIGENLTTSGELLVAYSDGKLKVYLTEINETNTSLRAFVGKDNEV